MPWYPRRLQAPSMAGREARTAAPRPGALRRHPGRDDVTDVGHRRPRCPCCIARTPRSSHGAAFSSARSDRRSARPSRGEQLFTMHLVANSVGVRRLLMWMRVTRSRMDSSQDRRGSQASGARPARDHKPGPLVSELYGWAGPLQGASHYCEHLGHRGTRAVVHRFLGDIPSRNQAFGIQADPPVFEVTTAT